MRKGAYYNEIEPYTAEWLRNLIAAGLIAPGDVDARSICDVQPDDLRGYTQCHFFAGIAGWSHALRLAGWPDDRPVWTGSCPCQPFSAAGKHKGFTDERHLWPEFFRLIRECNPAIVFGEQVARAVGCGWLDAAFSDLERENYACGTASIPACAITAPHERQRLWFVAYTNGERLASGINTALETTQGHTQSERFHSTGREWWSSEPDVGRVANGVSRRMGKIRAYGNAIVPQVAAEFIIASDAAIREAKCLTSLL